MDSARSFSKISGVYHVIFVSKWPKKIPTYPINTKFMS